MNLNRNKIIFIMTLTFIIVIASFYFFSEQKEYFPPPEKIIQYPKKEISVYISGQVKNPAVVTFEDEENLKIIDAVNAAGGLTEFADTELVNLAEPLSDGQHVHIPTKKILVQEIPADKSAKNKSSSNSELININTADETELQKIRGVGPAIAKRIIDFREENGNFQTIDDLKKVRGIGEKTFEKIKNSITT
ncbi:MAG: helix-hairpin-helix domain-containing protein [Selenomonadaceae bacterium]|nr:helix-hairpin-helix domain-containing protein [Selenomonadaceae bacterium]